MNRKIKNFKMKIQNPLPIFVCYIEIKSKDIQRSSKSDKVTVGIIT